MTRILRFIALDIIKNKIVIAYAIILALFSFSVFSLEDSSSKGILTVLNIVLLTVPLVSILFSTIYVYNSGEFIELLLSQPLQRPKIWTALFMGLSLSMVAAFLLGIGLPLLFLADFTTAILMIVTGSLLTVIFVALAFLSCIVSRDKSKGIGISIMLWLYFALLFDGLVLFLFFQFAAYPIEPVVVFLSALSPVDLSRILVLLQLEISAMMGYTGAVFKNYFGTDWGWVVSIGLLCLWIAVPFYISLRKFKKKDL